MNLLFICCTERKNEATSGQKEDNLIAQFSDPISDLKFDNKYKNFGKVNPDTLLTARFEFINIGDNPLIIYGVNPDCSCTDYYVSEDTIYSGEEAFIDLILNTKGKYGKQHIYAVVKANTDAKLYKLTLEAEIL
ncbi:MAG TPA: DUF1573 domain-containing protein [Bacteroidales bacterium]|nr:DUF1573 domain-containing protein [Bacteroidales bacterium]